MDVEVRHWPGTHPIMHKFANPTRFLGIARPMTPWLLTCGLLLAIGGCAWGLLLAPAERLQGDSVRIMFVHVPAAWLAMAGWSAIALASFTELIWRHPLAGVAARAIALPGALFAILCLVTGSLWGRPAWGTWWVWDGRLTSMLILFFLYVGYIALANAARAGGSRVAAVFGVVGVINLPIIKYSVDWWQSMHQRASVTLTGSSMDSAYLWPLLGAALGMALLFAAIVLMRMRAALAVGKVEARMRRLAAA